MAGAEAHGGSSRPFIGGTVWLATINLRGRAPEPRRSLQMRRQITAGALAVAVLAMAAPAFAQGQSCFFTTQWNGWKAADDHTVYLNVSGGHRIFRLDMAGSCPALLDSTSTLITDNHTDTICTALDWNLRVRQTGGFATACIVAKMTQLTPEQAAALPKNLRP
jgi:hypothetical protein